MQTQKFTGPGAGAQKYDILSALGLIGMHGTATQQCSMARLTMLITARYNWRRDLLSVGQSDMARMWAVDPRTVKREIKRLLEARILICTRQGVKGRVANYRLNMPEILRQSEPFWAMIGTDFAERMADHLPRKTPTVVKVDFARRSVPGPQTETPVDGGWSRVGQRVQELHPDVWQSWGERLTFDGEADRCIRLRAPSAFVAQYVRTHLQAILAEAIEAEIGPDRRIVITH